MAKKVLVCIGDSWTDDNFNSSVYPDMDTNWPKWPEHLAKYLDMDLINLGQSGSGNQQIFNKAVDVTNYADNIGGVVCMWSEPDRIDFEVHNNKALKGYNSITDSAFFHWSPRRSLGNKRQTHMPLEQHYRTFFETGITGIVQRQLQRSPTDFDHLADNTLKLGIWQLKHRGIKVYDIGMQFKVFVKMRKYHIYRLWELIHFLLGLMNKIIM